MGVFLSGNILRRVLRCDDQGDDGRMNRDDFGRFVGSLTADVLEFNPHAIPKPDTLYIRMTRGERRIADELHKVFGVFKRVVIDVDGEQHEFHADSLVQMLEDYEDAQGMSNHMRLFGTPERAAVTLLDACDNCGQNDCSGCQLYEFTSGGDLDYDALLEWLRGDA